MSKISEQKALEAYPDHPVWKVLYQEGYIKKATTKPCKTSWRRLVTIYKRIFGEWLLKMVNFVKDL